MSTGNMGTGKHEHRQRRTRHEHMGGGVRHHRGRFVGMAWVLALAIGLGPLSAAVGADGQPPIGVPIAPIALTPPVAIGAVSAASPVLHFSGRLHNQSPFPLVNVPFPLVCPLFCHEYRFTAATTTPLLVSVRDTARNVGDGWDIYVYGPTGTLVASAFGIGADGQAVELDHVVRGTYRIVVTFTYAESTAAAFHGEVRRIAPETWTPAAATCTTISGVTGCFELPVLRTVPASELHVDGLPPVASTPIGFPLPVSAPTNKSC